MLQPRIPRLRIFHPTTTTLLTAIRPSLIPSIPRGPNSRSMSGAPYGIDPPRLPPLVSQPRRPNRRLKREEKMRAKWEQQQAERTARAEDDEDAEEDRLLQLLKDTESMDRDAERRDAQTGFGGRSWVAPLVADPPYRHDATRSQERPVPRERALPPHMTTRPGATARTWPVPWDLAAAAAAARTPLCTVEVAVWHEFAIARRGALHDLIRAHKKDTVTVTRSAYSPFVFVHIAGFCSVNGFVGTTDC